MEIISDDKEVAEVFNKFFIKIVPDLKIPASYNCNKVFQKTNDSVINAINKYKHHLIHRTNFLLPQCNIKMFLEKLKV